MNSTLIRTACALAIAAGAATGAQADEPTLNSILGSGYTKIGGSGFSFASIGAGAGSTLGFSLLSENTAWASTQTFGIKDLGASVNIFSGSATNGAKASYTVANLFSGVSFASNSGNAQQYAPGGNDADFWVFRSNSDSNRYALAYEDYHYGGADDHNDMVIGLSVAAVPEPGTYALLLAGIGVVGMMARRRTLPV